MTKRLSPEERRKRILISAAKLIAKRGFSQTTTAAIAKQAGVTEPILYRHFRSKTALLEALLLDVITRVSQRIHELGHNEVTAHDRLIQITLGYPSLAKEFDREFQVINSALVNATDIKMKRLLRNHYESYQVLLKGLIDKAQQDKQIHHSVCPDIAAWHLINSALGYLMTRALAANGQELPDYAKTLAITAMQGLRPIGKAASTLTKIQEQTP